MKITELHIYMGSQYFSYKIGDKLLQDGKNQNDCPTIMSIGNVSENIFSLYDKRLPACCSPDERDYFNRDHTIGMVCSPTFRIFCEAD